MTETSFKEVTVVIDHLSPKGKGIGYLPAGQPVEVPFALVQEEVLVELKKKRRGKYQSLLQKVLQASSHRTNPKCIDFSQCGGCSLQHLSYDIQLKEKEAFYKKTFSSLLPHSLPILPIIGSKEIWEYRNKMEFSFSQDKAGQQFLGLMMAGKKNRVMNLQRCQLVSEWMSRVLTEMRLFWKESGLFAYHHREDSGHLRTLTVREAKRTLGKLIMLTVSGNPKFAFTSNHLKQFVNTMKRTVSEKELPFLSIFLRVQQCIQGSPTQFFEMHLHGPDHYKERLIIDVGSAQRALDFKVSPSAFFQPNPLQAEVLYSKAIQMLPNLEHSVVYDLYCGTATLSLAMALVAKKVIGIELNPHAVFDAEANQEENNIDNFLIKKGDVATVLEKWKQEQEFLPPDIIVVDPPRTGLDVKALEQISSLSPKQILYISCNPKTQCENISSLMKEGYQVVQLQPIDQFPHTMHLESIALLGK